MASELRVTTIANNAGTESVDTTYVINGSAKVWTADQTLASSNTSYTSDSFNVSSVTDETTGQCLVNFTNSLSNTGYASQGTQNGLSVNDIVSTKENNMTTSGDNVYIYDTAYKDAPFSYLAHGDLA